MGRQAWWQLHGRLRSGEHVDLRTRLDGSIHVYKKGKELGYRLVQRVAKAASG